jgi:hypothetical protein
MGFSAQPKPFTKEWWFTEKLFASRGTMKPTIKDWVVWYVLQITNNTNNLWRLILKWCRLDWPYLKTAIPDKKFPRCQIYIVSGGKPKIIHSVLHCIAFFVNSYAELPGEDWLEKIVSREGA